MIVGILEIIDMIYVKWVNYVFELVWMGVDIIVEGNMIIVNGLNKFYGIEVVVFDFWVGVCLVIVGLLVEGIMMIYNVDYILCGYDYIIEKLIVLGVLIEMIEEVGVEWVIIW